MYRSGFQRSNRGSGRSSSISVTTSTDARPATTYIRSRSGTIGRNVFLYRETDASEFTATISRSQSSLAALKYWTWPACKRSKLPHVKPSFLPAVFWAETHWSICSIDRILESVLSAGFIYSSHVRVSASGSRRNPQKTTLQPGGAPILPGSGGPGSLMGSVAVGLESLRFLGGQRD